MLKACAYISATAKLTWPVPGTATGRTMPRQIQHSCNSTKCNRIVPYKAFSFEFLAFAGLSENLNMDFTHFYGSVLVFFKMHLIFFSKKLIMRETGMLKIRMKWSIQWCFLFVWSFIYTPIDFEQGLRGLDAVDYNLRKGKVRS